jgi:ABC-type Fe3+-siderophore transport system permease subunit
MTFTQQAVKLVQTGAFYIGVGIIIWLGILMVIPGNTEAKESTKSKLISVLLGFLLMLSATIIVNAIINIIYEIFP